MNNFKADNSDEEEDKDEEENDDQDLGNESITSAPKAFIDLETDTKVTVRIKTMDDQEKRIEVTLSENVLDLKNKIFDQMQIPLERQRLIYLGKQLKDNMTLYE